MENVNKNLSILGMKAKDRVTGLMGIVTSVSFDLYGCVQAILHPGLNDKNEIMDSHWFDVSRLEIISKVPVMEQPNFITGYIAEGKKGPSEKPAFNKA